MELLLKRSILWITLLGILLLVGNTIAQEHSHDQGQQPAVSESHSQPSEEHGEESGEAHQSDAESGPEACTDDRRPRTWSERLPQALRLTEAGTRAETK